MPYIIYHIILVGKGHTRKTINGIDGVLVPRP